MSIPALPGLGSFRDSVNRVTINGCDLRYLRTGSARPLCCSTWVRAQLEYFAPLLRHLNTARFAVIAPDLPGHGESRAPCAHHTAAYFTDAIAGFLEAARVGGAIALALAAR